MNVNELIQEFTNKCKNEDIYYNRILDVQVSDEQLIFTIDNDWGLTTKIKIYYKCEY